MPSASRQNGSRASHNPEAPKPPTCALHGKQNFPALSARRSVPDFSILRKGTQGLFDSQEDLCLERADRTAPAQRQRDRSYGHVVGGLPQRDPVVGAEAVPEAVELATDRLDVRPSSLAAIFWLIDEPSPSL